MAEKRGWADYDAGGELTETRVRCKSCGDSVVPYADGRCPVCEMGVDGRRVKKPPKGRRDNVDRLGEGLIVIEATFAIITLAYVVASCG